MPPVPISAPAFDAWAGLAGSKRVLAVGRLVPVKGFDVLVSACHDLDVSLVIAGEGFERAVLEKQIVNLECGDKVRLLGHREDISELMAAADMFVISSHYEGGPYTLVESLHMHLPVVSTSVGASSEILPVQYLCAPGDIKSLLNLIATVLVDIDGLRASFTSIFDYAEKSLTFDVLIDQTLSVYNELAI